MSVSSIEEPPAESPYATAGRVVLGAGWLATYAAFVGAVALMWPYLVREHARMTPWQTLLTWASEAVSGFWFIRFWVRHVLAGVPLDRPDVGGGFWPVWLSLAAGLGVDAGLAVYKWRDEVAAFERAVPVLAQVVAAERSPFGPAEGRTRYYRLAVEFGDADGLAFTVHYLEPDWCLPVAVRAAVDGGRLPAPFPLRYDPDRPARTWMPHRYEDAGERVGVLTALPLVIQGGLLLTAARRRDATVRTPAGSVPLEQLAPFTCSAWVLLVIGLFVWAS